MTEQEPLHRPGHYAGLSREEVARRIREEGFEPLLVQDPPGALYPRHTHPTEKLLAFLRGEMEVEVAGRVFRCRPGDRLFIPGDTPHRAWVGPEGCTFFWSERLPRTPA